MKPYAVFYQKISQPFRDHPALWKILKQLDHIFTGIMYLSYPALLFYLWYFHSGNLGRTIIIPAVSFLLLSLVRDRINFSRPYEDKEIHALFHKDTQGHSMPSRHIFSSAIISMCFFQVSTPLAIFFLLVTACNAMVRVIGGVHYPRDVVVGAIIGILVGIPLL